MLGRHGKDLLDAEAMEFGDECFLLIAINLVDGKKKRSAAADEKTCELKVRGGEFRAAVDDQDDCSCFIERNASLAKYFGRNEVLVFGDDAAGVNDAHVAPTPLRVAVKTVASDA